MLTLRELECLQREVATSFQAPVGVQDRQALLAAIRKPAATRGGIPAYPTLFNKLSVFCQELLTTKPFASCNRQTALLALALLLRRNGYKLSVDSVQHVDELLKLVKGMEIGFVTWQRMTRWIKAHTVRVP